MGELRARPLHAACQLEVELSDYEIQSNTSCHINQTPAVTCENKKTVKKTAGTQP